MLGVILTNLLVRATYVLVALELVVSDIFLYVYDRWSFLSVSRPELFRKSTKSN